MDVRIDFCFIPPTLHREISSVNAPIGNLEDITIRAIKTLFSVDIIACEDTRRTGLLLQELTRRYPSLLDDKPALTKIRHGESLSKRLVSYYDQTEQQRVPEMLERMKQGNDVALVSDAGTPLISDPGFLLVREAIKQGINVVSIPGPTAAIAALTTSGLPTDKFFFLGYPPEKSSHRIKLFESLFNLHRYKLNSTYVLYCAPHKFRQTLEDMQSVLGDIPIVIARELTKVHEEVWRGKIPEAVKHFSDPQGEFVLLLHHP
ncbi:16S rRNA (cytidine(1402)-2'-O)-methyltransferase [Candidatus Gottesmanbacteria bacterium]|nr:16S rRNA (cytidine(1402)-2'-O)-methyltransferase [Candidatus Gottesmanbacteria bacterium]